MGEKRTAAAQAFYDDLLEVFRKHNVFVELYGYEPPLVRVAGDDKVYTDSLSDYVDERQGYATKETE